MFFGFSSSPAQFNVRRKRPGASVQLVGNGRVQPGSDARPPSPARRHGSSARWPARWPAVPNHNLGGFLRVSGDGKVPWETDLHCFWCGTGRLATNTAAATLSHTSTRQKAEFSRVRQCPSRGPVVHARHGRNSLFPIPLRKSGNTDVACVVLQH